VSQICSGPRANALVSKEKPKKRDKKRRVPGTCTVIQNIHDTSENVGLEPLADLHIILNTTLFKVLNSLFPPMRVLEIINSISQQSQMGNPQSTVTTVQEQPETKEKLQTRLGQMREHAYKPIIEELLSGATPSNFTLDDMCETLKRFSDTDTIFVPSWTLNLAKTKTAAITLVNNFPALTKAQREDADYLASLRLVCPLFKPGEPIGHARVMFVDNYNPMALESWDGARAHCCEVASCRNPFARCTH